MFKTEYSNINSYLTKKGITKEELFQEAANGQITLLLYLETLEGFIASREKIEASGLCKLSTDFCEKMLLENEFESILLYASLELIEGKYKIHVDKQYNKKRTIGWETVTVSPTTKSLIFQPYLYENRKDILNPRYTLKKFYTKPIDGYCYSVPIEKILILEKDKKNINDKAKPLIKTLNINQLLERWNNKFSLENIYEIANHGYFGIYFRYSHKRKTYHDIKEFLEQLITAKLIGEPERNYYLELKNKFYDFINKHPFLLDEKIGFVRLATSIEEKIFSMCDDGSITRMLRDKKIISSDELSNNTFGFVKSGDGYIAESYHRNPNYPFALEDECFVFLDQIEQFEKKPEFIAYLNNIRPCVYAINSSTDASLHNIELPDHEYIHLQSPYLKKILQCHSDIEVLQYAFGKNINIRLNVKLHDNLCVRERSLIVNENGQQISYLFAFPEKNKSFPSEKELEKLNQDLKGKSWDYKYDIVKTNGFEIIPQNLIQQLILGKNIEVVFFEIEDRSKQNRTYVQKYLGYKDESVKDSIVSQPVQIENLYIKKEDILKSKKGHNDYLQQDNKDHLKANITDLEEDYIFRKNGDAWFIKFLTSEINIRDLDGLHYINKLLHTPKAYISATDLREITHKPSAENIESTVSIDQAIQAFGYESEEDFQLSIDGEQSIEQIDPNTRASCNEKIKDLEEEIQEAQKNSDLEKIEKLEEEKRIIKQYLNGAININGKMRPNNQQEKNRKAVQGAISVAKKQIKKYCSQHKLNLELYEHLKCIKTGNDCVYQPTDGIIWQ